jgi:hypothetical protein
VLDIHQVLLSVSFYTCTGGFLDFFLLTKFEYPINVSDFNGTVFLERL